MRTSPPIQRARIDASAQGASEQVGHQRLARVAPILLALLIASVFWRTYAFDFTNYDERHQLLQNPLVRGLSWDHLSAMFTGFSITSYYPVRLLSFAVDHACWGYNPAGYHLTNVLLHATTALLLYWLIRRLLRVAREGNVSPPRSAGAAALACAVFAIHPVIVEPVAWVAGREELLVGFFGALCLHCHLSGRQIEARPGGRAGVRRWALGAAATFACAAACFSNVAAAVVPAIAAAMDRLLLRTAWRRIATGTAAMWVPAAAAVLLKTMYRSGAAPQADLVYEDLSLGVGGRLLTILQTYALNFRTLIWPTHLVAIYPNDVPQSVFDSGVLAGLLLVTLTALALYRGRSLPMILFGIVAFLLGLAPSSQILPHFNFRANRFLYLPLLALTPALAAGVLALCRGSRAGRVVLPTTAVLVVALAVRSTAQVETWRNSLTLFDHCLRYNPSEPRAYNNRGSAWAGRGDHARAAADFSRAIELAPYRHEPFYNRGRAWLELGEVHRAIVDFGEAVRLAPDNVEYLLTLADALSQSGDYPRAVPVYSAVLDRRPSDAEAWCSRGAAYLRLDQVETALMDLHRAVTLESQDARAYNNRGVAHVRLGHVAEARHDWEKASSLDPDGSIGDNARANLRALAAREK